MKFVRKETYIIIYNAASAPKQDSTSSMPFANALIIPYWLVRRTDDRKLANMHYATLKSTSTVSVGKEESSTTVTTPILQNNNALEQGTELMVFEEKTAHDKRRATIEPEYVPSKKARRS